ncbi:uncharacterized protein LOC133310867 [Gastrolobium bilobum]|uniref:uncharacterized protein LOC133310867 n=1 Tax=Gastrolobium bilobum TaxID=150636 RepID=UPI002AB23A89|nr:uncharacterized protein LOC133310867 [Gastrolobium bilobum]
MEEVLNNGEGGDLLDFTYPETYRLLEKLSKKHVQWPSTRNNASKKAGVLELSSTDALSAQMASLQNTIKNWKPMEQKKPTDGYDNNNRSNDNYQGNNNRGWKSQNNAGGSGGNYQNRPPYPRQNHQNWDKGEGKSQSFETFVKEYMNQNSAAMRSLETQIDLVARSRKRELARQLMEEGVEEATDPQPLEAQTESREKVQNDDLTEVTPVATTSGADVGAMKDNEPVSVPTYVPPCKRRSEPIEPHFPQRLKKQHEDKQFSKFLDLLKQLHINVPLVEALEQMPSYAKFMKDVLSKKRRIEEFETVALTKESCNYLTEIPPKLKDLGIFTIPCTVRKNYLGRALCDLGSSVNLMPASIFKQLDIGAARPTTVTLQLADRSIAKPFLATGDAVINVRKGELSMSVNGEEVKFNVMKAMKFDVDSTEECSSISTLELIIIEEQQEQLQSEIGMKDFNELEEYLASINSIHTGDKKERIFESLNRSEQEQIPNLPSVEQPPTLELKPLPEHLKYIYLGKENTLPVIISSLLTHEQELQLT